MNGLNPREQFRLAAGDGCGGCKKAIRSNVSRALPQPRPTTLIINLFFFDYFWCLQSTNFSPRFNHGMQVDPHAQIYVRLLRRRFSHAAKIMVFAFLLYQFTTIIQLYYIVEFYSVLTWQWQWKRILIKQKSAWMALIYNYIYMYKSLNKWRSIILKEKNILCLYKLFYFADYSHKL